MIFLKCCTWFIKEYANVGIAFALFLLIGLQIEKQYRATRYLENCLSQDWTFHSKITSQGYDLKTKKVTNRKDLEQIVYLCSQARKASTVAFNYFKGMTHIYISKFSKSRWPTNNNFFYGNDY